MNSVIRLLCVSVSEKKDQVGSYIAVFAKSW